MKVVFTIVSLLVVLFILKRFGKNIKKHYTKDKQNEKLPDPLQEHLPDLRSHYIYAEYFFFFIIALGIIFGLTHYKSCLAYEIVFMFIVFQFIKEICSMVTILPDPSDMCEEKGTLGACNDLMPSGHMSTLLIILFSLWPYMTLPWKSIFSALIFSYSILIIAVRNHYTIDIIMSMFVVFTIYSIIHPYILKNFNLKCY